MDSTPGIHLFQPLQYLILPPDIEILQKIKKTISTRTQLKIQERLSKMEKLLRPIYQYI